MVHGLCDEPVSKSTLQFRAAGARIDGGAEGDAGRRQSSGGAMLGCGGTRDTDKAAGRSAAAVWVSIAAACTGVSGGGCGER